LTQNSKKIIGTPNHPIRTKIFPKCILGILKVSRSQKFVWGLPDGIRLGTKKKNKTQFFSSKITFYRQKILIRPELQ
jgi:hypothetical protein